MFASTPLKVSESGDAHAPMHTYSKNQSMTNNSNPLKVNNPHETITKAFETKPTAAGFVIGANRIKNETPSSIRKQLPLEDLYPTPFHPKIPHPVGFTLKKTEVVKSLNEAFAKSTDEKAKVEYETLLAVTYLYLAGTCITPDTETVAKKEEYENLARKILENCKTNSYFHSIVHYGDFTLQSYDGISFTMEHLRPPILTLKRALSIDGNKYAKRFLDDLKVRTLQYWQGLLTSGKMTREDYNKSMNEFTHIINHKDPFKSENVPVDQLPQAPLELLANYSYLLEKASPSLTNQVIDFVANSGKTTEYLEKASPEFILKTVEKHPQKCIDYLAEHYDFVEEHAKDLPSIKPFMGAIHSKHIELYPEDGVLFKAEGNEIKAYVNAKRYDNARAKGLEINANTILNEVEKKGWDLSKIRLVFVEEKAHKELMEAAVAAIKSRTQ